MEQHEERSGVGLRTAFGRVYGPARKADGKADGGNGRTDAYVCAQQYGADPWCSLYSLRKSFRRFFKKAER